MPATPAPTRPDPETIAQQRALLAAARERQKVLKAAADRDRKIAYEDADQGLEKAIAAARQLRVSWNDISAATGLSRQAADGLLKS